MAQRFDGSNFHVDDLGSGPAVVLFHGMPSPPSDFEALVQALLPHRRVLVPHFPGYGRTPPAPGPVSSAETLARLETRLADLGVERAAAVAFSAGAYQAVALALGGRVALERMVLLAPVVGFDPPLAEAYRDMAAAAASGAYDPRPSWLERMANAGFAVRDPAGAARVVAWLDAVPLATLCGELLALANATDLRPRLGTLRVPTLVLSGTGDNAVAPALAAEVARALPLGTFRAIEGAGHALLVEAPARTVELIAGFLLGSDGTRP